MGYRAKGPASVPSTSSARPVGGFSHQVQHETGAYAQEFFARHLLGAPQARMELRIGVPTNEVLAAVETLHAELVAVGWPHTTDPARGAVAPEILERSPSLSFSSP